MCHSSSVRHSYSGPGFEGHTRGPECPGVPVSRRPNVVVSYILVSVGRGSWGGPSDAHFRPGLQTAYVSTSTSHLDNTEYTWDIRKYKLIHPRQKQNDDICCNGPALPRPQTSGRDEDPGLAHVESPELFLGGWDPAQAARSTMIVADVSRGRVTQCISVLQ